jgi:hypothetical protein
MLEFFGVADATLPMPRMEAVAGSHSLLILNFRPEYHAAWMNLSWYRQIREFRVLQIWESFFSCTSVVHLALGDPSAARAAGAEGVAHIRKARGCWSSNSYAALARAQFALHEPSVDIPATLDEYAALLARTGFALFEGELHELGAQLAARDGERDAQVQALHRAHAGYVRFGMTARADRVRALINAPDE